MRIGDLTFNTPISPDKVSNGYGIKEFAKDSMCIEFIAKYVSLIFTKNTIRKWIDANPDS